MDNLNLSSPAPQGTECILYLSRKVHFFLDLKAEQNSTFFGSFSEERDVLSLLFQLRHDQQKEFFDLRISEPSSSRQPSENPLSLAKFQQAEIQLQFLKTSNDGSEELIHEEPSIRISLDLPHAKFSPGSFSSVYRRWSSLHEPFSVTCTNVVPSLKLWDAISRTKDRCCVLMRINIKLMKGETGVLHGIQKCFHPDKALYDLRDKMETILIEGINSDAVMESSDEKFYKVHRSILAANSEMFEAMFRSGMRESRTGKISTPDFMLGSTVEALLKHIYSRNRKDLENCPYLTVDVLRAAHHYRIQQLVEICEESLLAMPIKVFTLKNVLYTFHIAVDLDNVNVQSKCVHIIMRMEKQISKSKTYLDYIRRYPIFSAKLTEMILQFQSAQNLQ